MRSKREKNPWMQQSRRKAVQARDRVNAQQRVKPWGHKKGGVHRSERAPQLKGRRSDGFSGGRGNGSQIGAGPDDVGLNVENALWLPHIEQELGGLSPQDLLWHQESEENDGGVMEV